MGNNILNKSNGLLVLMIVAAFTSFETVAQVNWGSIKKQAKEASKELPNLPGSKSTKPSDMEVVSGLKEALETGVKNSSNKASAMHGYFGNPKIRIPFPQEAESVKNTALNLGMKNQVNKFEYTMNRAAEEAAKEAAPIFIKAVKEMNVSDGWSILQGGEGAATKFLQNKTTSELSTSFKPIIKKAIEKVQVTKYWNPIITKYNQIPGVNKQNPDLDDYITQKAIVGMFVLVAEEENKIRKDPAARISDLLKKVFSYAN